LVVDPAIAAFEVLDVLPYRTAAVRGVLQSHGIGTIEVKKRGVDHDPEKIRRELAGPGAGEGTVMVTRLGPKVVAIIARRVVAKAPA
jgi:hypothetical protein